MVLVFAKRCEALHGPYLNPQRLYLESVRFHPKVGCIRVEENKKGERGVGLVFAKCAVALLVNPSDSRKSR
jgi:hypothetical protein